MSGINMRYINNLPSTITTIKSSQINNDQNTEGNIKDLNGKVIGVHDGIINFTIGQRKGIKVSDKEPLYVIEINAEKNEIIVAPKKNLAQKKN